MQLGLKANTSQVVHWLLQVLFVGLTLGITRVTVPALAEQEYGIAASSYLFLSTFVIAFGAVKGSLNFVAGRLAERLGRKPVHLLGWIFGLPVPWLIWYAPDWNWIVFAMVLLGVNQGLCWSMTQTAKLDITAATERGLTIGLNEFSGYLGVALGGLITAYAVDWFGMREGLLYLGNLVVIVALIMTAVAIRESMPWLSLHAGNNDSSQFTSAQVFRLMSGGDRNLTAVAQAGSVEKFVDALVWVMWPIYLYQQSNSLETTAWVISIYGITWGLSQLLTGHWSDRIGRKALNVWGMALCGLGVIALPLFDSIVGWSISAFVTGFGMALLYPNLSAAIVDATQPGWRASAIGIYRFWRDLGYAIGALGIGLVAYGSDNILASFWFVGIAMLLSALWLQLASNDSQVA